MEAKFQYFHNEVLFWGKHKEYIDALWTQNNIHESFFRRLLDLYATATVIGLRINRRASLDSSGDKRTIQVQQLLGFLEPLNTIMQLVLLLDESDGLSEQEKIDRAFRGPQTEEEFNHNVELFNSYARGGIEYLYEALVLRVVGLDDDYQNPKIANIIALLNDDLNSEI